MHISRCDFDIHHITAFVTSCMRFIRKALLVFALMEYAAFRVGRGFGNGLFFNRLRTAVLIIMMIVKRLLSVCFTVSVDLLHQLLFIFSCCLRNRLLHGFMEIGVCFNMCAVNENSIRRKIPVLFYLTQYPFKYLVDCFLGKTMLKVLADRREMRELLIHQITKKPTVCDIHLNFFAGTAQRRNAVQMLNENDLEQHDRIHTRSAIVMTIQISDNLIDFSKIQHYLLLLTMILHLD